MPTRGCWPVRRGSAFTLRLNGPRASDARGVLRGRPLHARRRIRGLHPSARPDPPVRGPEPLRKRHQSAVQRHGYPGRSHHLPPLGVHPPATCGWSRGGQRPRRHPWRARPVHGPRRCGSVRPRGGRRPGGARRSALLDRRTTRGIRDPDSVPTTRLLVVGFAAGVVGGIYGLGGAALVVPWLVSVERLSVRDSAGPGLVVTLTTSAIGLATFTAAAAAGIGEAAAPDWSAGLALGLGGAAGAVVGARLQPRLPVALLRTVLAIAAIAAGLRLLV